MNRFEELIAKYLDDTATPDDEAELAHLIQTNGENRQEFFACYEFDQLLTVLHKPANDTSIEAILTQLRAESDPFVESVVQEVRDWEVRTPRSSESWWEQISRWLDGRRVALGVSSALALALITGLLVWFFGPTMGDPILAEFQGNGVSVERGTEFIPASIGISLKPADILRTGTNETATLTFGRERTRIDLYPGTELRLNEMSRGKRFTLRGGKLEASVARQRPFRPMILTTPNAQMRVLGTRFTLTANADRTQLDVLEGKVRLTRASDAASADVSEEHYAIVATNTELVALPQTGWIFREYWTNLPGTRFELDLMAHPSFPDHPNGREWLGRLETTKDWGDDYGARWRGYLHPPISGDYRLALAAADEGCFYLSKNDQPENKIQVQRSAGGSVDNWNPDQDRRPNQFTLTAGRRYYIEVLHKAGQGEDRLSVAWRRPDGKVEVISGEYLSPFKPKPKEK